MYTKLYNFILNENVQQAKSILKKLGIVNPNKETDFISIKDRLNKMPNLIGLFTKFRFEYQYPMEDINKTIDWLLSNKNIINKLPKNILQYKSLEELNDDIIKLSREQNIKKFYNSLYRSMKEKVDKLPDDKRNKFDELASEYMKLPKEKKDQFTPLKYFERNNITINDFINALESFIEKSTVNDNKDKILEKIKKYGDKVRVVYNENNILVVQTEDSEAICDLGSQNWCIVYGGDNWREQYFGIDTFNTQYIIFNFNLPSTSANSQFGVTIKPDGTAAYGGSQDKLNNGIDLKEIKEITGIPDGVLVPDESKKELGEEINKIIDKYNLNNSDLSNDDFTKTLGLNDLFKDIKDSGLSNYKYSIIRKIKKNRGVIKINDSVSLNILSYLLYNDLKDKNINDVIRIVRVLIKYVFNDDLYNNHELDIIFRLLINKQENKVLAFIKVMIFLSYTKTKNKYRLDEVENNFYNLFGYDITNLDLLSHINYDYIIKVSKEIEVDIDENKANEIVSIACERYLEGIRNNFLNEGYKKGWEYYKKFYDKYQLPHDTEPYDYIYNNDLIPEITVNCINDDGYISFLKEVIFPTIMKPDELVKEITELHVDEGYDYINNDEELFKLCDEYDKIPIGYNSLIDLWIYRNTSKYNKEIKKRFDIKIDDNGQEYVLLNDFTEFDEYFDGSPFQDLEDTYEIIEYYKHDDYQLSDSFDDLDYYNVIYIASLFEENETTNKYINFNLVKQYLDEDNKFDYKKNREELVFKYEGNEKIDQLHKNLSKMIFTDLDEIQETDSDLYYFIDDEIKNDIIDRAMNQANESSVYSQIWNKTISEIKDLMGSKNWKDSDVPYKWSDNNQLLFTIDFDVITDDINIADLYYEQGDSIRWEGLISFITAMDGKKSVNYDYIYPDYSKKGFNEEVRNT